MNEITFFTEDLEFSLPQEDKVKDWIIHTVEAEGYKIETISYIFCSDEYLHKINVEYLDHDYYTDIITFDNSEEDEALTSDLFISIERVKDNAEEQSITFIEELRRVVIHGVLHLVGYHDKTPEQKKEMRQKENAYLSLPEFQ
ncbi:MAG: rRNA maturation RNase YbeY [Reichenbachiella sp.]